MGYRLFSQDWVEQFMLETAKGPDPERKQKVDENYWNWIEMRKQNLNIRLGLVLKDEHGPNDSYAYFDLEQGNVVNSFLGSSEIRGTADFVLSGTEEDWYEIIEGPRELTQNMMYRKVRLVQGNLHSFFRNIYFFVEFLRCGIRVQTEFEHLKTPMV
jgi:putative sterol carrier protein